MWHGRCRYWNLPSWSYKATLLIQMLEIRMVFFNVFQEHISVVVAKESHLRLSLLREQRLHSFSCRTYGPMPIEHEDFFQTFCANILGKS